ncbi:MAG: pre-peptidase C-terminal domain-containing protein, partial [Cyanobacteria bacterium P01_D01_bin.116]
MEPKISLRTITGTFNGERNELRDTLLAESLVESLGEQPGSSILVLSLQTEGEIPSDGVEVVIDSDIALTDYFANLGRTPLTYGAEVVEAVYNDDGIATGIRLLVNSPNALISLPLENKDEVETDGIEQATFSLEAGSGYTVDADNGSSTVFFEDSLDSLPVVDPPEGSFPTVSLSVSNNQLVESEGDTTTFTFNVDGDVPEDGILVYINSEDGRGVLGEFDVFNAEISGGTTPFPNFAASGFYFKILEDGASITVAAFDETTNPEIEEGIVEGVQQFTFEVVNGPSYSVSDDAGEVSVTIADNPDSQIQVSYTVEPETLVEADSTVGVHNFTLSSAPPEEGITVRVVADGLEEFDPTGIETTGISGDIEILESAPPQLQFTITEQSATINLPVAADSEDEGLETATFTLQAGDGYQVDPEANTGIFNLVDTVEQIPPATEELSEPNDTLELAQATGLNAANSEISITGEIDYNNSNRYEVEGGRLYVDFTEDVDLYSFELAAGDTVRLDTDAAQTNLENPSELDTVLRLFDADGNQLADSDDDGAPDETFVAFRDSYIEYTAETDGTYYAGVSSFPNGEFSFDNNPYEPTEPASGTGRSSGEYTLNVSLNTENTPSATEITPGDGSGPAVSLQSTFGTFNGERNELRDTVLAPNLVEFLGEQRGASLLSLALNVEGEIPEDGVEVVINSDFDLTEYFGQLGRSPFTLGGEILGAVYDDSGNPSGIRFLATSNNALISIDIEDLEEAETDGPEVLNFNLESSAGYVVNESAATTSVTVYDTLEDVPAPTSEPTVGINISETNLIESEGTEVTVSFNIDGEIPEEGVLIYANTGERAAIGEFNILDAEVSGGVFPTTNFASSGFYFRAFEDGASVTLNVFDETSNPEIDAEDALEGIEEFTLSLVEGPGYTIADNSSVTYSISDNPDSVVLPEEPEESEEPSEGPDLSEGNDTITDAIVTGLSAENPTLTVSGEIDSDRATRNLVDASEDVDMYSFELKAGDTVSVDVDSIPYEIEGIEETQRLDSELRLFDAEGNELDLVTGAAAPDEIFNANRDAYLEFTAEEAGTYYVGVAALSNRTYDPFEAGTGSGRVFPDFGINIGEYDISFNLTS